MKNNIGKIRKRKDNIAGWAFVSLYVIGLVWMTAYPFIMSFYYAFTDYNIFKSDVTWVGFDNFVRMFTEDAKFWVSLKVTLKFAFIQVPIKLAFSLMVAMILSKATKLVGFYRVAFYIPSLLGGGVAVAITWKQIWGNNGAINSLLRNLGFEGYNWLTSPDTALYVLILLGVWAFGSQMLIFLAALKNVPQELHEAAILDGATAKQRFFKVTLPMLTPALFFNLIQSIIGCLQAFNSSYLISGGKPLNTTLYYALHQYNKAFVDHEMGYASAMAWFLMLIILGFTALTFKSSSAWVYYQSED